MIAHPFSKPKPAKRPPFRPQRTIGWKSPTRPKTSNVFDLKPVPRRAMESPPPFVPVQQVKRLYKSQSSLVAAIEAGRVHRAADPILPPTSTVPQSPMPLPPRSPVLLGDPSISLPPSATSHIAQHHTANGNRRLNTAQPRPRPRSEGPRAHNEVQTEDSVRAALRGRVSPMRRFMAGTHNVPSCRAGLPSYEALQVQEPALPQLTGAVAQAELARLSGDPFEAMCLFDIAIQENPKSVAAWYGKSSCCLEARRFEESLQCAKQCLKLRPMFAQAYDNMGRARMELRQYAKATAEFQKAAVLSPKGPTRDKILWKLDQSRHVSGAIAYGFH